MAQRLLLALPLLVPLYLLRFKLGPLPTTAMRIVSASSMKKAKSFPWIS
jgi:hypothetical protein